MKSSTGNSNFHALSACIAGVPTKVGPEQKLDDGEGDSFPYPLPPPLSSDFCHGSRERLQCRLMHYK